MKGSGDEGKWWRRGTARKGSGDEGRCGEEGKWWRREVVTMGRREWGKWNWRECCKMHCIYWLHECCMGFVLGGKPESETLCFSVWSGCRRRWKVPRLCGGCGWGRFMRKLVPPRCSATSGCSFVLFFGCLESVVADRSGMAAGLLSSGAAMCVERCGLATWCCKMHCNGCMSVAGALFWGGSRSTKPFVVPCKVAAGGDERYLVCAAGAAGVVSCANWFLLCVLQRVAVPACVVLCVSWICSYRSQWKGRRIVVIWCCHVRREMRVSHVMLQNAL